MKKLLFALIAITMFACSEKKPSFTINGTIEIDGLNEQTLLLKKRQDKELVTVDSIVIKENKFTFSGNVDNVEIHYLVFPNNRTYAVIVENTTIDVIVGEKQVSVTGTELNNITTAFVKQRATVNEKMDDLYERYNVAVKENALTKELEAEMDEEYEAISKELQHVGVIFLEENINNAAGECFFSSITSQMKAKEIEDLLANATEETLQKDIFKNATERIQYEKAVEIGQPFVDIEMPNPQDEMIKLSDYAGKGKYVLIDFWASWCGPCVQEMPHLIELYAKYKNKNFEIVGVSFDRDKNKWLEGIEKLQLPWPQMSDIKFWSSEGAKLYNVRSIPHTVLINPEGIIVEKNLRAKALEEKLAELIK